MSVLPIKPPGATEILSLRLNLPLLFWRSGYCRNWIKDGMSCVILKITQVPRHTTLHPKLTAYCIHCAGRFYPTFYGLVNKVYGLANGSQSDKYPRIVSKISEVLTRYLGTCVCPTRCTGRYSTLRYSTDRCWLISLLYSTKGLGRVELNRSHPCKEVVYQGRGKRGICGNRLKTK